LDRRRRVRALTGTREPDITQYLQQSLTGLGTGAVVALLAVGLVLTFRASNVLNFAHAAMGMYVAYTYYGLRNFGSARTGTGGDLVLPVIGLPAKVHVVDRPTVITALMIALVVAVALGTVVYGLVFRPLRNAPPLARVVASLGIFLYLQAVMQLRVPGIGAGSALQLKSFLPRGVVRLGDAAIPASSFALAAVAIVCAIALSGDTTESMGAAITGASKR